MDIYKKIVNVMRKVSFIPKETEVVMRSGKYAAVSHDTVARLLHPILAEEGIIVKPSLLDSSYEFKAYGSSEQIFYRGVYAVDLISASDGSSVTYRVEAHSMDSSDKAPGKALSYAVKMALLKAFVLESGEEDEARPDAVVRPLAKSNPPSNPITPEQAMEIRELLAKTNTEVSQFLSYAGVSKIEDIDASKYDHIIELFERKLRKMTG